MSKIKLEPNASGSGTLTISAPNTNSDRTISLPDKAGEVAVGAGTVVQVVFGSISTEASTTSTSFVDTGLTATITPTSSSNKILVLVNQRVYAQTDNRASVALYRGGSDVSPVADITRYGLHDSSSVGGGDFFTLSYLDSPSSTSAQVYKTVVKRQAGSASIFVQIDDDLSTITLMEIVA